MKKLLLLLTLLAYVAIGWAQDAVTGTYTSNKLDVALSNNTEFVAFQMDIALTDANFAGDPVAALDRLTENGGTNPFILASNVLSDGKLRVIAYNMENRAIDANAGTLFTVALDQKPSNVEITNVLFVRSSDLAAIDVNATTKAGGKVGDVNGDEKITTLDLTALLKIILNKTTVTDDYDLDAADVNADNKITTLDLTALLKLILGK